MNEFRKYDHVRIKDLSGGPMDHFPHSTDAIVLNTYADEFGGENDHSMCLFVNGHGEVSWYEPCNLELIEHDRKDILDGWKKEMDEADARESDLDWIFEHGKEIAEGKGYTGTIAKTLFRCLTDRSIWGTRGEGYVFYMNALAVHDYAKPFLENNDKKGWLEWADNFRNTWEGNKK